MIWRPTRSPKAGFHPKGGNGSYVHPSGGHRGSGGSGGNGVESDSRGRFGWIFLRLALSALGYALGACPVTL